jgi:hypothetical protein
MQPRRTTETTSGRFGFCRHSHGRLNRLPLAFSAGKNKRMRSSECKSATHCGPRHPCAGSSFMPPSCFGNRLAIASTDPLHARHLAQLQSASIRMVFFRRDLRPQDSARARHTIDTKGLRPCERNPSLHSQRHCREISCHRCLLEGHRVNLYGHRLAHGGRAYVNADAPAGDGR